MSATSQGEIVVTTDRSRLDLDVIHGFLTNSYWARGIAREAVARSMEHSLCFGAFDGDQQVGFARVISDRTTFAYVCDVFALESHRGRGLSKWLMECVHAHPELQGFRRWVLLTRDAHGLYARHGWKPIASPDRYMERWTPGVYRQGSSVADASPLP